MILKFRCIYFNILVAFTLKKWNFFVIYTVLDGECLAGTGWYDFFSPLNSYKIYFFEKWALANRRWVMSGSCMFNQCQYLVLCTENMVKSKKYKLKLFKKIKPFGIRLIYSWWRWKIQNWFNNKRLFIEYLWILHQVKFWSKI